MKKFEKNQDFVKIKSFLIFEDKAEAFEMNGHSTSPPCGNLVDGLPHACHNTETVAKPGRLGPAQNGKPMSYQGFAR